MNTISRYFPSILGLILALELPLAANPERLTPERIDQLATPVKIDSRQRVFVEVSGFGKVALNPFPDLKGTLESIREFRYPTEFNPPKVSTEQEHSKTFVIPTTPSEFETINAGWTIRLRAKQEGGVVVISAIANYIDVTLVNGDYGALAGAVYDKKGNVIAANRLQQPVQQTTTTRFHLSAIPGETYEIVLYKGKKQEKHTIKVWLE